jgi:DNA-binding MarR family transcriptional regulator
MSEDNPDYQDFFNAQNEIHALFDRVLEPMFDAEGITLQQVMTLKALKGQDTMCRMSDLAAMRFLTPAAATGIVDRLIHMNLVERKDDEKDRRVILLALTSQGEKAISILEARVNAMIQRFFEHLSESDRAASMRMFRKLKEYLKEEVNTQKRK